LADQFDPGDSSADVSVVSGQAGGAGGAGSAAGGSGSAGSGLEDVKIADGLRDSMYYI
jgi:hypothetical protein